MDKGEGAGAGEGRQVISQSAKQVGRQAGS